MPISGRPEIGSAAHHSALTRSVLREAAGRVVGCEKPSSLYYQF
jgi:hypothetical protein